MFDKIKEFFAKSVVKIVEVILILVCAIGLIIGGVSVETIAKVPALAGGIVLAVIAVIDFIRALIEK